MYPDGGRDRSQQQGGRRGEQQESDRQQVGAARGPIGLERASQRREAPPRRAREDQPVTRPELPEDEEPQLPRGVIKEISRALGAGRRADDVALALSVGSAAIDEERPDVAVEVLAWAKEQASRLATIREAYGVALYQAERYAEAASELQAYRRMSGRNDQNHVLADCLRALGRDIDRIAETAGALVADDDAPLERRAEAAIVWAATLADGGDLEGGLAVLRRFTGRHEPGEEEHDLRLLYLLADLCDRAGDRTQARRHLERIAAVDPGFLDVQGRLDQG